ncbi:caspase domain-containing protein [Hypoxylon sp. NC1633]|nr:caspase domain-containing protein [Hypoxylon sp. NC1633]
MADKSTATTLWAVLIGINYYKEKPLQGGVQDAAMVKQYLEGSLTTVNTTILTATTPPNPGTGRPVELDPELWPTRINVIKRLKRVIDAAKPGDLVHIHYSGHGTSIPSDAQSESKGAGELALVLFEANKAEKNVFEGRYLASAIRRMVEKGCIVTLVLDCCFSGSVVRSDEYQGWSVRCVDYDSAVGAASAGLLEDDPFSTGSTLRGSEFEKNWLIDPDGYAIFSACGPHGSAFEVEVEGHGRRGALTYYLLDTLRILGRNVVDVSHRSIHEHLSTRFHSYWPRQTPMNYGNMNRSIFGNLITTPESPFISAYMGRGDGTFLHLRAGKAHGICEGDEFAVSPFRPGLEQACKLLKVQTVRDFESDLINLDPRSDIGVVVAEGWKARLVNRVSLRRIRVRISPGAHISTHSQWKDAAKGLPFLHLSQEDDNSACIFNVLINEQNNYHIVDALHDEIAGLPTIPADSPSAMTNVLDILHHLATFKYFEGVENRLPDLSFQNSFSLQPYSDPKASGAFQVEDGGKWGFTIKNTTKDPLYIALFNFTQPWEISNMVSSTGGDSYLVVPPQQDIGKREVRLVMKAPDGPLTGSQTLCEEIIKVFITRRPVSFPTMVLPKLSFGPSYPEQPTRGASNPLAFLEALPAQLRGQDDVNEGEKWWTCNFIINIIPRK